MKHMHDETRKLYENIAKHSSADTAQKIAFGLNLPSSSSSNEREAWVKFVCRELEMHFDEQTIKNIRSGCYCGENRHLDESKLFIKNVYDVSASMEDFVDRMNERKAGWFLQDGYLFTKYPSCSCPMLDTIETLPTKTWCYCTVGYNKVIFEHVFNCEVDIELMESIKMGHQHCLMKIIPKKNS